MKLSGERVVMVGAVSGALAVGAGAFGAHALADVLTPHRMGVWSTAAHYHLLHSVVVATLGLVMVTGAESRARALQGPAGLFVAGIAVFSGSLYTLCLSDVGAFGAITPIGGVALIAAWIWLAVSARSLRTGRSEDKAHS